MEEIFTKKWFIATIVGWIVIVALDELTYYWWKQLNPGSMYSGILVKHPTQNWDATGGTSQPNGPFPAGGINSAG